MIGRTLGSYRILEQIGIGGMAMVYKAYDPATDRHVAVKVLPEHYSNDPQFRARFEREARAIAQLEHPFILPIHSYGEEDGTAYLVMRYVAAGTLKDRIARGSIGLQEASAILSQVADALDYAHEHHILHRDIKPSNILLDDKGNAFLTDFGIAKMVEASVDLTGAAGILGTPAYMSPEQCQGRKDLTAATDQYSLGVMLYEMLTGRTPYQAETPLAIINMQLAGQPMPLPRNLKPDLPESIEKILLKALAKRPQDRFDSCMQMAHLFAQAVEVEMKDRPDAVTVPHAVAFDDAMTIPVAPRPRPARRFPRWLWPALVVLLVAGIGVGALILGWLATHATSALAPATGSAGAAPVDFLYDDFSRNGAPNPGLWANNCDTAQQANGVLTLGVNQSVGSCSTILSQPSTHLSIEELGSTEAQFRIASDYHGTGEAWISLLLRSLDAPGGHWWAECGLMARPGRVTAEYDVQNFAQHKNDYSQSHSATFDRWYTIRLVADPKTMTFSCYMDGKLLGSAVPSDAEALRNAHFQREIQSWRGQEDGLEAADAASATVYADNMRIIPGGAQNTPSDQPTPVPSDPTLYDDFSASSFDGKFDPTRWAVNVQDEVSQQDGVLVLRQKDRAGYSLRAELARFAGQGLSAPTFFQADVSLNRQAHAGGLSIMVEASRAEDRPSMQEIHCVVNANSSASSANLNCFDRWNMGPNTFEDAYNIPARPVDFGSWHTVRIEINPASMAFTYYIDGERAGTHTPSRANILKTSVFTFLIELHTPTADESIGYVDHVRIGPFAP